MYPFDTYDATFQFSALVLTNLTTNSTDSIACDEIFNADDDTVGGGPLQLAIDTSQDLDGFEGKIDIQEVSDDQVSFSGPGTGQVSVNLGRKPVIRFFAVVMFVGAFLALHAAIVFDTLSLQLLGS
jgi:hypothetical protein